MELKAQVVMYHKCSTNLEIVSKRPVTKHLKKGVMISVMADVVKIVVLTSDTDTFLTINDTSIAGHFT